MHVFYTKIQFTVYLLFDSPTCPANLLNFEFRQTQVRGQVLNPIMVQSIITKIFT